MFIHLSGGERTDVRLPVSKKVINKRPYLRDMRDRVWHSVEKQQRVLILSGMEEQGAVHTAHGARWTDKTLARSVQESVGLLSLQSGADGNLPKIG